MQKETKSFETFTNIYELSKTLRFELRPVGNTQKMLEDNKIFAEDKIKQEKYLKIKPYFDRLHREFARESLEEANLTDLKKYYSIFEKIKNKKDFSEIEKDFDISVVDVFSLDYYNKCLLQEGIDRYNKVLGGETIEKTGAKKKGINELINEYRQSSGDKLPFLKSLDKQILSEKESFIEGIENEQEFFDVLREFSRKADEKIKFLSGLVSDFVKNNESYELDKVYLSKEAFNTISNKWANDVYAFQKAIAVELKIKEKDGNFSFPNFISIVSIKNALQENLFSESVWKSRYYKDEKNEEGFLTDKEPIWEQFLQIFENEYKWIFRKTINRKTKEEKEIGYEISKKDFDKIMVEEKNLDELESKIKIKDFADDVLRAYQMGKYFAVEKKRIWNPENLELGDFYSNPDFGYQMFYDNAYDDIVKNYNHLRNYLTKKPWEDNQKWKLNFENPSLASGFDKNKESSNSTVILRKEGRYYLGIMKKGCNYIFDDRNLDIMQDGINNGRYEKMIYKLLPGANKMLPKVFFSKSNIDFFNPSDKILEIRNYSSHTKGGLPQKGFEKRDFNLKDCHAFIDFFKESLNKHKEWKNFDFIFSDTSSYENISDFYREVENGGYKIFWQNISESYIEEKNQKGEFYFFEIHNKDWNLKDGEKKTGTKNLHTLYFENLFSSENKNRNFVFKLNGQAELFFRLKTDENKLEKKKDKNGNEVIDHKRYANDKILFHCPIAINRARNCSDFEFKQKINNFLADNSEINIIGIDRGEKHLAYYSVITQKEEILEMGSLNEISGVNYAEKLNAIAEERKKARVDWQKVEGIKDLKKGYISQVVRKLADLAIEHNAIIVFEDLNMRFKQIRGGIEKSVYQQLEKALIEKLSFLVKKGEKDPEQAGHLLKAYQLSAPFETFKDMGKQTGIIFYTQAEYTSITDPVSGFRKNIYINNNASIEKIKSEMKKFDKIDWDENLQSYFFQYDAKEFNKNGKGEPKEWTIYADVSRIRREKENGYWKCNSVNPNEMMKDLLVSFDFDLKRDIKEQIKNKESKNELGEKEFDGRKRNFYKSLVYILNLILQVRNSFSEEENGKENYIDFIASPVSPFFATEAVGKKGERLSIARFDDFEKMFLNNTKDKEKIKQEFNGDANGAFNIARKGIIILDKISSWQKENEKLIKEEKKEKFYPDLFISYSEWDRFVQK